MSSDDDFGTYDPTTPMRPTVPRKSTIPANQPVAGPSRATKRIKPKENVKPASVVASERRKQSGPKSKEQSPPEVTVVIDDDDEEAEVVAAKPPPKNKRARGNSGENSGTGSSVTKGKARANGVVENEDVMEVDEVEVVENGVPEPPKGKRSGKTTKSPQTATVGRSAEEDALRIEVETLKAQLEEVTAQKDKLANKLEELFHLRHTEPEAALESQAKQYEAHLEVQENLLKEQAKLIEASTSGKPYMLHFLSREAADEEKKEVEKELARWKEVVKQRDVQLIEKDKHIAGLENQNTLLNRELQAEVERAKTLKVKNSPRSEYQGPRTAMPDIKDPLVSAVHRLYEDLTNLLILRVTLQKSQWPGMPDDRLFDCIINFPQNGNKSLHFTLLAHHDKDPSADPTAPMKAQLQQKVQFQPVDLDKESDEFVAQLDFFRGPFVFVYEQLFVFLKTIAEKLNPEDNESEGDQVENDELADDT